MPHPPDPVPGALGLLAPTTSEMLPSAVHEFGSTQIHTVAGNRLAAERGEGLAEQNRNRDPPLVPGPAQFRQSLPTLRCPAPP